MPKSTSANFKTRLASEDQNTCLCFRIERKDGTIYGYSTNDVEFDYTMTTNPDAYGSITFKPVSSFNPSDMRSSAGSSVDNIEVLGAINLGEVAEDDIEAGLFADAEILIFRVDPTNLADGEMIEKRGFIGDITYQEGVYNFEILALSSRLKRNVGLVTTPLCRIQQFCNAQCKLTESTYTHNFDNDAYTAYTEIITGDFNPALGPALSRFAKGNVVINLGMAGEVRREIKEITGSPGSYEILLHEYFSFDIAAGSIDIVEGCDRTSATCQSLSNMINFRGENLLPTNEVILTPGRHG